VEGWGRLRVCRQEPRARLTRSAALPWRRRAESSASGLPRPTPPPPPPPACSRPSSGGGAAPAPGAFNTLLTAMLRRFWGVGAGGGGGARGPCAGPRHQQGVGTAGASGGAGIARLRAAGPAATPVERRTGGLTAMLIPCESWAKEGGAMVVAQGPR
jgi:hypothetical protein